MDDNEAYNVLRNGIKSIILAEWQKQAPHIYFWDDADRELVRDEEPEWETMYKVERNGDHTPVRVASCFSLDAFADAIMRHIQNEGKSLRICAATLWGSFLALAAQTLLGKAEIVTAWFVLTTVTATAIAWAFNALQTPQQ